MVPIIMTRCESLDMAVRNTCIVVLSGEDQALWAVNDPIAASPTAITKNQIP